MIDFRPILFVIGILLATLGGAMLVPALADAVQGNPDWRVFCAAAGFSVFVGGALYFAAGGGSGEISIRQAFILTTLVWTIMPAFAALPFAFSELELSYTDAYFEAMSGLTTTGSTVIVGLDFAPPGLLLWRALLQWLGGIGIIVMAVAILPLLRVGGMQLFRMESSDTSEKVLPRAASIAGATGTVYLLLTVICIAALWAAQMPLFDATAHAMTTIATGGFSTSDGSIGMFDNAAVDWIIVCFMLLGSLPFVLYLQVVRGRPLLLWRDSQVRWFFAISAVCVGAMTLWTTISTEQSVLAALRYCAFNVVSIVTGTGYSSTDYGRWGTFAVAGFFFFMFIGGCAGSTSCGVKIFRFQVLYETTRVQMGSLLRPHSVLVPHYNGRPIPDSAIDAVMSFFFLFALVFGVLAVALTAIGLDFITAISGAATALANVGPGLGDIIGPSGTFQPLPDAAKWVLSAGMLLGRLELFTVLVLFTRRFWQV